MINRKAFTILASACVIFYCKRPPIDDNQNQNTPSSSSLNGYTTCHTNPYQNSINTTFNTLIDKANDWLDDGIVYAKISAEQDTKYINHDHSRFFPFQQVSTPCNELSCIGGPCSDDHSKFACGMRYSDKLGNNDDNDSCIIYSIGGNNEWQFELDLLKRTKCHVHTFDCTGKKSRFKVPTDDRLTFHHICLGANDMKGIGNDHPDCNYKTLCGDTWSFTRIQKELQHTKIDLLKLDIEGWEWTIFDIEYTKRDMNLPMQLLMEVHYDYKGHGTRGVIHNNTMSSAMDVVRFQKNLLRMGYVVVHQDDNPSCRHCTELTLLRVAC